MIEHSPKLAYHSRMLIELDEPDVHVAAAGNMERINIWFTV
jgi:hypothetical protein